MIQSAGQVKETIINEVILRCGNIRGDDMTLVIIRRKEEENA